MLFRLQDFVQYNLQSTCNFLDLSENRECPRAWSRAGGNLWAHEFHHCLFLQHLSPHLVMAATRNWTPSTINWFGLLNKTKDRAQQIKKVDISNWSTWKNLPQTSKPCCRHEQRAISKSHPGRSWTLEILVTALTAMYQCPGIKWFLTPKQAAKKLETDSVRTSSKLNPLHK